MTSPHESHRVESSEPSASSWPTGKKTPKPRRWPDLPEALPHPVTDNHTHILAGDGDEPLSFDEHVTRAESVGIHRMIHIGCDVASAHESVQLAKTHSQVRAGVALHPTDVAKYGRTPRLDAAMDEVFELAGSHDEVVTLGETGMDAYWCGPEEMPVQEYGLRAHISAAKELDLPLQIHDRETHREILDVLASEGAPERTVFHCFSGDAQMAEYCVARGWYLSFAGPVTFKANEELRRALRAIPLSRVLVETDAPYLTPHPDRGKPNSPYMIPHILRCIAQTREMSLRAVCEVIEKNSETVYGRW